MWEYIRGIGCVFILVGSVGTGIAVVATRKRRQKLMNGICHELTRIQSDVRFGRMPLSQIFQKINEREKGEFPKILGRIAGKLEMDEGRSFYEIWREEMIMGLSHESLPEEFLDRIVELGLRLGGADYLLQEKVFEQTVRQLEEIVHEFERKMAEQNRISISLGITAGISLLLLLW